MKRMVFVFGILLLLPVGWWTGNSLAQEQVKTPAPSSLDKLPLATLQRSFPNGFPIPTGEKLEYEVRFSRFPIYATVGIVTFEFLGEAKFTPVEGNGFAEPAINGLNVEFKPAPGDQFFRLRASAISKGILVAIAGVEQGVRHAGPNGRSIEVPGHLGRRTAVCHGGGEGQVRPRTTAGCNRNAQRIVLHGYRHGYRRRGAIVRRTRNRKYIRPGRQGHSSHRSPCRG